MIPSSIPLPHEAHEKQYFVRKILRRKPAFVDKVLFNVLATTDEVDTVTTLSLRLRMHLQSSVIGSGRDLELQLHESERPPQQYRLKKDSCDVIDSGLPPTRAKDAPCRTFESSNAEKESMETVTACLVSVLGVKEEQIQFCRPANGAFESLHLPGKSLASALKVKDKISSFLHCISRNNSYDS